MSRGDGSSGKPLGRDGVVGFARRIAACVTPLTLSKCESRNCAFVVWLSCASHMLATISAESQLELDFLRQNGKLSCNCSPEQLCRCLLRLYSCATTGGDWARFIFRFSPQPDSDVAVELFFTELWKHCCFPRVKCASHFLHSPATCFSY